MKRIFSFLWGLVSISNPLPFLLWSAAYGVMIYDVIFGHKWKIFDYGYQPLYVAGAILGFAAILAFFYKDKLNLICTALLVYLLAEWLFFNGLEIPENNAWIKVFLPVFYLTLALNAFNFLIWILKGLIIRTLGKGKAAQARINAKKAANLRQGDDDDDEIHADGYVPLNKRTQIAVENQKRN